MRAKRVPGVLDLSIYVLIRSGGGGDPTADIMEVEKVEIRRGCLWEGGAKEKVQVR
jgi:hypothetical protein